jgi:hypothetical protein
VSWCAIEEGGWLQELDRVAVVVGIIQKVGCPADTKAKAGARGEKGLDAITYKASRIFHPGIGLGGSCRRVPD